MENFFRLLAQEVRQWLARLGVRSLGEIVGRTDLLEQIDSDNPRQRHLDLAPLLASEGLVQGGHCGLPAPPAPADALAAKLEADLGDAIEHKRGGSFEYAIRNTDRSIGARLSGRIARAHGDRGMIDAPITVRFRGVAGQSFGAFQAGGLNFELTGEANDYVGKGMAGGRIVLRPPQGARWVGHESHPVIGCAHGRLRQSQLLCLQSGACGIKAGKGCLLGRSGTG